MRIYLIGYDDKPHLIQDEGSYRLNVEERHCRINRVRLKPLPNSALYHLRPVQSVWDWRPNTSSQPGWWQNPVVSTC